VGGDTGFVFFMPKLVKVATTMTALNPVWPPLITLKIIAFMLTLLKFG